MRRTFRGRSWRWSSPPREDWPFISVFLDGADEPYRKLRVHDEERVSVFSAEHEERHRIRIVKLNENFRTCLGVRAFHMEGALLPFEKEKRDVIEFIGDSITCGFGNDTQDVSHEYESAEEDGWMTHGAIAAGALGLEPWFVCVSGISIENVPSMPGFYCMRDLYPYAYRVIVDKLREENGDRRLFTLKYNKMMNVGPTPAAACIPPSTATS